MTAWRPEGRDWRAMLAVVLIPVLLALPQLTPWLKADPLYYTAKMSVDRGGAIQQGAPYIDPNNGYQTQALGYRAVMDWASGQVPWWNPYAGIGMPLAAEYQGAAFFPLTALVALPRGMVLLQMALQVLAGLGAYSLARQLGLSRLAAFMAGAVFGVNGTLAWLSHGPAGAVPWLPWILLGIERASIAARERTPGGWRLLAGAMAMSLLAGFPETAYINGLLALAWAVLRGLQAPRESRAGFVLRVAGGGIAALAIASPQVVSFLLYLPDARIGGHGADFASSRLEGLQVIMSLVAPYVVGPPWSNTDKWALLFFAWGNIGGYVGIALVIAALHGFLSRRDALGWLLLGWIVATLGKSFGIEPFVTAWNLVPGVKLAAFERYAPPSWTLALVLLAARGVDAPRRAGERALALRIASYVSIGILVAAALHGARFWIRMPLDAGTLPAWFLAAMAWAALSTALVLMWVAKPARRTALALFLAAEASFFCAIPIVTNARAYVLDLPAVEFLRANIGLNRFYTLEPIAPNYGTFFGIASINHNYLPVPDAWVRHVREKLDRQWSDDIVFNGDVWHNSAQELKANLRAFEEVGVKYVVTKPDQDPLAGIEGVRLAYSSPVLKIFELPRPAAYFEDPSGACAIEVKERTSANVRCEAPSTLVRRELFYPGWTVTVNGADAPIAPRDGVFQAVALPPGSSEVHFRYSPEYIGWTWLAAFLGLAALAAPPSLLRRKHQ